MSHCKFGFYKYNHKKAKGKFEVHFYATNHLLNFDVN